jgi:hypothetical protein
LCQRRVEHSTHENPSPARKSPPSGARLVSSGSRTLPVCVAATLVAFGVSHAARLLRLFFPSCCAAHLGWVLFVRSKTSAFGRPLAAGSGSGLSQLATPLPQILANFAAWGWAGNVGTPPTTTTTTPVRVMAMMGGSGRMERNARRRRARWMELFQPSLWRPMLHIRRRRFPSFALMNSHAAATRCQHPIATASKCAQPSGDYKRRPDIGIRSAPACAVL